MKQLTEEQAIEFGKSSAWESMTYEQRAKFQMQQEKLCMPFSVFHEAMEKTLGRGIFTHEFGLNFDGLYKELFQDGPAPTLSDIINMIPKDKQLIVLAECGNPRGR
jgi:hypothetical protein